MYKSSRRAFTDAAATADTATAFLQLLLSPYPSPFPSGPDLDTTVVAMHVLA
jgi:hypothetical protein